MKKQCPYCKEMIDENLTVCPFCCEDLPIINKPSFIICPYCNEKIKLDLKICPICCEEIPKKQEPEKPKTKICPYCKEEIDFDLNICPVCCEKLTQTIANNNSINTEKYEVNPKNTKKNSEKTKRNTKQSSVFDNVVKHNKKNKKDTIFSRILLFSVIILLISTLVGYFLWNEYSQKNFDFNYLFSKKYLLNDNGAKFIVDESAPEKFFLNEFNDNYKKVAYLVDKNENYITDNEYGICPGFNEYPNSNNYFSEGLACVVVKRNNKEKCGYINSKGEFVIKPIFDNAGEFSKGYATAILNSEYGLIDKKGNFNKVDADSIGNIKNGYAKIIKNNKNGLINHKGILTIPYTNNLIIMDYYYENGNYCLECFDTGNDADWLHKCAYVNKKDGKRITDYKYAAMGNGGFGSREFSEGLAQADIHKKFKVRKNYSINKNENIDIYQINFIDKNGKEILKTQYIDSYNMNSDFGKFHNDAIPVKKEPNGLIGYINKKGKLFIPLEYSEACSFKNNYALVKKNNKWGFIDKKNNFNFLTENINDEYDICNKYYIHNKLLKTINKSD